MRFKFNYIYIFFYKNPSLFYESAEGEIDQNVTVLLRTHPKRYKKRKTTKKALNKFSSRVFATHGHVVTT